MYCGSCLRDNALAGALKRGGHDVTMVPLFSPVRTDTQNQSGGSGVYFGGINIYLQHASRLFRKTPRAVDWLFDRQWLLNVATNYGSSTPPEQLVDLTLDLLKGTHGHAAKEVRRLARFIRDDLKPDVVTLPNLMFLGVAPVFREMKIPVVCELTGEDVFLDALGKEGGERVQTAIRTYVQSVDRFVATSGAYADRMATYLGIDRSAIAVVYPGLPKEFLDLSPAEKRKGNDSPTVGYLARICPEKGFENLIDAMIRLRDLPGMSGVQLRAAGYLGKKDVPFFEKVKKRIDDSPLRGAVHYVGEVDQSGKIDLLQGVDVFSVPAYYPEAKGIYLLEAMANGLAAVQPATGSYPELMAKTRGGVLTEPNADALARGLAEMLSDRDRREKHGTSGRAVVREEFTDDRMAGEMLSIFEEVRR